MELQKPVISNEKINDNSEKRIREQMWKINKPLILLKASFFLLYGNICISPLMTVFLKERGINETQLSYIYFAVPVVQIIADLLLGIMIDKTAKHKLFFCSSIITTMITISSLIAIPEAYTTNNNNPVVNKCQDILNLPNETDQCTVFCRNITFSFDNVTASSYDITDLQMCCSQMREYVTIRTTGINSSSLSNFKIKFGVNETNLTCKSMLYNDLPHQEQGEVHDDNVLQETGFRFIYLLLMTVLFNIARSNCCRCLEVTAMHMVITYKSDLGKQTIWASLGIVCITPFFGLIIQLTTAARQANNYPSAFYLYDLVSVVLLFCVLKLDVKSPPPSMEMWKKARFLFKNVDFLLFEFIVVIFGISMFYDLFFAPFYLKELGASSFLISLKPAADNLISVPILLMSDWWFRKIGLVSVFVCGLACSSLNFLIYSFIVDPWWCLVCAMFPAFYRALPWIAIIKYAHQSAPEGLTATTITLTGTMFSALGLGLSCVFGGSMVHRFGPRRTFQCLAVICFSTSVLYASLKKVIRHIQNNTININGQVHV